MHKVFQINDTMTTMFVYSAIWIIYVDMRLNVHRDALFFLVKVYQ